MRRWKSFCVCRRCPGKSFLVRSLLARRIWLWVDSNGTDGSQHSIGAPTCHDFPRLVIISEKSRLEVGNRWRWSRFFEKRPLEGKFQNIIPKGFTTSQNHVLCANFVKFGWPEIGKVVRCLPEKKTKLPQGLPLSLRHFTDRAQNLPGPARNNILGVPKISSKSVHFRRSYSRTREHRWNAPQSISNSLLGEASSPSNRGLMSYDITTTEIGLSTTNLIASLLQSSFYSAQQCWHCKRCTSYGNSVRPSVCHTPVLCQNDGT